MIIQQNYISFKKKIFKIKNKMNKNTSKKCIFCIKICFKKYYFLSYYLMQLKIEFFIKNKISLK